MAKAKRAHKAETPKQPSLCLRLRTVSLSRQCPSRAHAHSKGLAGRRGMRSVCQTQNWEHYVDETGPHSGTGSPGAAMPVYELGSFAGRGVSGGMLPPARQGPGQWRGWCDVEGVRRASGREPAGLGGPDEGEAVQAAACQTGLHSQGRALAKTARPARPGGQDRPEGDRLDFGGDLRGGLSGLLVWFSSGAGLPPGAQCGGQDDHDAADQPRDRRGHQRLL